MRSPLALGLIAGAAGTLALNVSTYLDMAARGRASSSMPAKAAGKISQEVGVGLGQEDTAANRKQGIGALLGYLTGLGVGAAYGLLRSKLDVPTPLAALGLGAAAMAGSDTPLFALGLTDPRKWPASSWVMDIAPHLAYGITTTAVFDYING